MKTKKVFVILGLAIITSCSNRYIVQGEGIQVEKVADNSNRKAYTIDNKVYKHPNVYDYSYEFTKNEKRYYFKCKDEFKDLRKDWEYVEEQLVDSNTIVKIRMKVLEDQGRRGMRDSTFNESMVEYNYVTTDDKEFYKDLTKLGEQTGLIENSKNIWLHPPRMYFFQILQMNPWPYVKFPLRLGNKWDWQLEIGSRKGDQRWKEWEGNVLQDYKYEISGKQDIDINGTKTSCYIIEAKSISRIGETQLKAYYNKDMGFVKLIYDNIDGSELIMTLLETR